MKSLGSKYYLGCEIAIFWEPRSTYMAEVKVLGGKEPLILITKSSYAAAVSAGEAYINEMLQVPVTNLSS